MARYAATVVVDVGVDLSRGSTGLQKGKESSRVQTVLSLCLRDFYISRFHFGGKFPAFLSSGKPALNDKRDQRT